MRLAVPCALILLLYTRDACYAMYASQILQVECPVAASYKRKFGNLSPSLWRHAETKRKKDILKAEKNAEQAAAAAAFARATKPPGLSTQSTSPGEEKQNIDPEEKDRMTRWERKNLEHEKEKMEHVVKRQNQLKAHHETDDVTTLLRPMPLLDTEKRENCVLEVVAEKDSKKHAVLLWPSCVSPSDAANPASAAAGLGSSADGQAQNSSNLDGCSQRDTSKKAHLPGVFRGHIVVPENAPNDDVLDRSGYKTVIKQSVGRGVNVAIIAYGQTGSGKTHTLGTSVDPGDGRWTPGLAQMSVTCFVEAIRGREAEDRDDGVEYTIRYSAYEVWLGQVSCCHLHVWLGSGNVVRFFLSRTLLYYVQHHLHPLAAACSRITKA